MISRRNFVKNAGAGLLAVSASSLLPKEKLYGSPASESTSKEELFKVGMAGFTFRSFTIDQTLEMMQRINVHYLCIKDFHLPINCTPEDVTAFHAKLAAKDVVGYGVGPIYMKSEKAIDDAFDYAKRVGVKLIVGIPSYALLPYVEQKVKTYDIRYAIHNHGPEDKLFPNAKSVIDKIGNMDERMGLCMDIGHDMRDGQDPANDLKKYIHRVFDMHIKNVTIASKAGETCEMGRGVIDIPAFVKMLRKTKYNGVCSLEFEKDGKDPLPGVAESIGYLKGVLDGTK